MRIATHVWHMGCQYPLGKSVKTRLDAMNELVSMLATSCRLSNSVLMSAAFKIESKGKVSLRAELDMPSGTELRERHFPPNSVDIEIKEQR